MDETKIESKKKIYCNTCKTETHHELIKKHPRLYKSQVGMMFKFRYNLWVCLGCDTAILEEVYAAYSGIPPKKSWSEAYSKENATWESTLYPKRKQFDIQPKLFLQLNDKLAQIYKDVIKSFNNDSRILCAIGLRALLEGICADKGVKISRSLPKTIDGLEKYLPSNIVKNLHSFRFMGNIAVHELEPPNIFVLHSAIEIIEDLLNFLYELEYKAQSLLISSEENHTKRLP